MKQWVVMRTGCDKGTQEPLEGGEKLCRFDAWAVPQRVGAAFQRLRRMGPRTVQRKAFIVPGWRAGSEVADNIITDDGLAAAAAHEGCKA